MRSFLSFSRSASREGLCKASRRAICARSVSKLVFRPARSSAIDMRSVILQRQCSHMHTEAGSSIRYDDPSINNEDCIAFGEYESISSQSEIVRPYSAVKSLGAPASKVAVGEGVWIRGRVAAIRQKGKSCFLVIRSDSFYTIQACHFVDKEHKEASQELLKFLSTLNLESIVDIYGSLQSASVKSCSQDNVEIHLKKIYVVSKAPPVLPFLLEDAARPNDIIEASQNTPRPFAAVAQVYFYLFAPLYL